MAVYFVRHGETEYAELRHRTRGFDPQGSLDPHNLDLTEKGMLTCKRAAEQLRELSGEKSARSTLFATSPQWRAHSSALVIADAMRIENISPHGYILPVHNLRNIVIRPDFDPKVWIEAHGRWKARPENAEHMRSPPHLVHELVIKEELGLSSILDVFEETHEDVDRRVRAALRYFLNHRALQVVLTGHEESVNLLLRRHLGTTQTFKNGQVLELRMEHPTDLQLELHSIPGVESECGTATVSIDVL